MTNAIPAQRPAVVLRSSYRRIRTLLAIATVAILGLTIAVVVLATNGASITNATPAARATPETISSASVVRPNPDQQAQTASPPAITSASVVRPNPDQQVQTASPPAISSASVVRPNPDQQG